jgi:hypothetical protein
MEVEKTPIQLDFENFPECVAIIGSRSFTDNIGVDLAMKEIVRRFVSKLPKNVEVVSGGARGVDTYAAIAARRYKRKLHEEWPDTHIPVPTRFFVRNKRIVDRVKEQNGVVVAFVEIGNMRGTAHALGYAAEHNVPRIVFYFHRRPLRTAKVDVIGCEHLVLNQTS